MEKKKNRKIVVHPEFDKSLEETYQYLRKDSPEFAERFKDDLIEQMEKIIINPMSYPKEELIPVKSGIYRSTVFKKSWKIIYKVMSSLLIFLKLFHVKQNPKKLKEVKKYRV